MNPNTKLPQGTLNRLWADPINWRAHFIYVCKTDPRVVVPKRNKWDGWTLNFAHRAAWIATAIAILSAVVPAMYFAKERLIHTSGWYAFLVGYVVISCVLCFVLSSPKRYEEP